MALEVNFDQAGVEINNVSSFSDLYQQKLTNTLNSSEIGFLSTLKESQYLSQAKDLHQKFSNKTQFFHVGIGGSSLGPEMLLSALRKNKDISFEYLNNVDPDDIHQKINKIKNIDNTLFYIVSKSGGTAETVAAFISIINLLDEKFNISINEINQFVILCTDEHNGELRKISKEYSIDSLIVPSDVGGRFSVLTPVGFFPALFAGIDCDNLIQSALQFGENQANQKDSALYKAAKVVSDWQNKNVTQTVLMPYSSRLKDFTSWFVQLWAESLGKKQNIHGQTVHTGLTPIAAYGSTDQHSQMQLFMEGPKDKLFFLLEVKNFNHQISLKNNIDLPSFQLLNNTTMAELMAAEFEGAKKAMTENELPVISLVINELNEKSLGELIIFFELLTALMGEVLEINPFDQPGVEIGKVYTKQILSSF